MSSQRQRGLARRTIEDFGVQWTTYRDATGYFGSPDLLVEFIDPFDPNQLQGARVADIGAGTGRHTASLLALGARMVYAVEPSNAVEVIRERFEENSQVEILHVSGDHLPPDLDLDCVISIGVIHHIPEPKPVIDAAYAALRPGGHLVLWLYGREGNGIYLALALPLRLVCSRLPHGAVAAVASILDLPLRAYLWLCTRTRLPLPLKPYMASVVARLTADKRRLVIYDQLKPAYAKYYTRREAIELLESSGFVANVHHRRGYSWVAIGTKPYRADEDRVSVDALVRSTN